MEHKITKTAQFSAPTTRQQLSYVTKSLQNLHSNIKGLDFYDTRVFKQHQGTLTSKNFSQKILGNTTKAASTSNIQYQQLKLATGTPSTSSSCSSSQSLHCEKRQPRSSPSPHIVHQAESIVEMDAETELLPQFHNGIRQHARSHTALQLSKPISITKIQETEDFTKVQLQQQNLMKQQSQDKQLLDYYQTQMKKTEQKDINQQQQQQSVQRLEQQQQQQQQQHHHHHHHHHHQDNSRQPQINFNQDLNQNSQNNNNNTNNPSRHHSMHSGTNVNQLPTSVPLYSDLEHIKGREKKALFNEWSGSECLGKWEEKNVSSHTLIERVIYESSTATPTPQASQHAHSLSISRQSSSRSRDFTSQIQTIPGNQTTRALIEKSLTPKPIKIHPLNILAHESSLFPTSAHIIQSSKPEGNNATLSSSRETHGIQKYQGASLKSFDTNYRQLATTDKNQSTVNDCSLTSNNSKSNIMQSFTSTSRGQTPTVSVQIQSKSSRQSRRNSIGKGLNPFVSLYKEDYSTKTSVFDLFLQKQQETATLQKRQAQINNFFEGTDKNTVPAGGGIPAATSIASISSAFKLAQKLPVQQQQKLDDNKSNNLNPNSNTSREIKARANSSHLSVNCVPLSTFDLASFQNYSQKDKEVSSRKKSFPGKDTLLRTPSDFLCS